MQSQPIYDLPWKAEIEESLGYFRDGLTCLRRGLLKAKNCGVDEQIIGAQIAQATYIIAALNSRLSLP